LLDLSKFDAGVIEPNISYFRLDSLLERVVEGVRPAAQQKGLALNLTTQPLTIASDILLLERLIRNLILNAVQFTQKGAITVSTEFEDGELVISVEDTGYGIDAEDQRKIFQDYYQVHNRARTKGKGSGLGLAIVKRIAALLHMKLSISSELGKGSIFKVAIPDNELEADNDKHETRPSASENNEINEQLLREVNLDGAHILIVDDDETILDALSRLIRDWGGNPVTASTFAEVKELTENPHNSIELAILDDMLNENTTGLDIAKYLTEKFDSKRIVLTTGNTAKERLMEIRSNGFMVLTKPVDPLILSRTIGDILS